MKLYNKRLENLSFYSRVFSIPLNLIMDSNPHFSVNDPAQKEIHIPGYTVESYTSKFGESLKSIAECFNVTLEMIQSINCKDNITEGDIVYIPKRVLRPLVIRRKRYSYSMLRSDLIGLKEVYPFVAMEKIGESVIGNDIFSIKLGRGKRKIQMNASFHANEWITTPILMDLLNAFLLGITNNWTLRGLNAVSLYENIELTIVPMVNPDGVDLVLMGPPKELKSFIVELNSGSEDFTHWKANIRGVDLNKQFPAGWFKERCSKGIEAPSSRDYTGTRPLSEPESRAMAHLALKEHFDLMIAFHTQGKEFYWGYEGMEPRESIQLASMCEKASGYKSVCYVESHAGYKDWFIQEFRKPALTLELGKGINPLPLSQYEEIFNDIFGIFLVALIYPASL